MSFWEFAKASASRLSSSSWALDEDALPSSGGAVRLRFKRAHSGNSASFKNFVSVSVVPIRRAFFFKSIQHYNDRHSTILNRSGRKL